VLPTLLALLACQPTPTDPPGVEPTTDEPIVEDPGATPSANEPVDGEAKLVMLSAFDREVSVAVGSTLHYRFQSHGSVGYGAEQRCSDETVVRYVRTDIAYEQSEAERAGKTGADAATGTFVFEAIAPGTVDELFRGSVERSATFTIVVAE
jgi:hypothetical protein